jgi:hypothetical protein
VVAALDYDDAAIFDGVDEAMFLINAARPEA